MANPGHQNEKKQKYNFALEKLERGHVTELRLLEIQKLDLKVMTGHHRGILHGSAHDLPRKLHNDTRRYFPKTETNYQLINPVVCHVIVSTPSKPYSWKDEFIRQA